MVLKPCPVGRLSDPQLPGAGFGLASDQGVIVPDPRVFTCCGGTGFRDASPNTVLQCRLSERLKLARTVFQHYTALYPGDEARQLFFTELANPGALERPLGRLRALSFNETQRGLWLSDVTTATPSIWVLALASGWRYGLLAHSVVIGTSKADEILPKVQGVRLMIIDLSHGMWQPHYTEQVETLVNYAYSAMIPVFVRGGGALQVAHTVKTMQTRDLFRQRIAGQKAKPFWQWLSPSAQEKCRALLDGLPPPEPPVRAKAGSVVLPWDLPR